LGICSISGLPSPSCWMTRLASETYRNISNNYFLLQHTHHIMAFHLTHVYCLLSGRVRLWCCRLLTLRTFHTLDGLAQSLTHGV
jgi:hypothetical protein